MTKGPTRRPLFVVQCPECTWQHPVWGWGAPWAQHLTECPAPPLPGLGLPPDWTP